MIYKYRKHSIDIKDPSSWSSEAAAAAFNLDIKQLNALQRSLTQKVCAISTTKENENVLIATEIIATLYQNTDCRILIVCHSGKTLTKLLADIEMYTEDIARIANHDINDQLDQFNLNKICSNYPNANIYKLINAYRYILHTGYKEAVEQFTELQMKMKESPMRHNFMDEYLRIQVRKIELLTHSTQLPNN